MRCYNSGRCAHASSEEDSYCQQLEEAEAWQEQVMNDEFRNVVETVVAIKRVFVENSSCY